MSDGRTKISAGNSSIEYAVEDSGVFGVEDRIQVSYRTGSIFSRRGIIEITANHETGEIKHVRINGHPFVARGSGVFYLINTYTPEQAASIINGAKKNSMMQSKKQQQANNIF